MNMVKLERDMRSALSGPNLWPIWQEFDTGANPHGANGYNSAQIQAKTIPQNGENLSSSSRDMGFANLATARLTTQPDRDYNTHKAEEG